MGPSSSALAHCAPTPWTHHQGSTAGLLPWPHPSFIFMLDLVPPGLKDSYTDFSSLLDGLQLGQPPWLVSSHGLGLPHGSQSSTWPCTFGPYMDQSASGPWSSPWTWSSLRNSVLPQELCMSTLQIWKYKYPDDTECIVSLTPQLVHTSTWTLTSHGFFFSWSSLWPCTHMDLTSTRPSTFIGTWFHTDLGHQARYFRKSSRIGPSSCPGPSASSLDLVHYLLRIKSVTHFGLLIRFQMDL